MCQHAFGKFLRGTILLTVQAAGQESRSNSSLRVLGALGVLLMNSLSDEVVVSRGSDSALGWIVKGSPACGQLEKLLR